MATFAAAYPGVDLLSFIKVRSTFDAGLSCRRRSDPGRPCRDGTDTAGSPAVGSEAVSSKVNKKRTWPFPVFISRRSKRKCIGKHVHAGF